MKTKSVQQQHKPATRVTGHGDQPFFQKKKEDTELQAKLKVGSPRDPLEQEADRMADHVTEEPAAEKKEEKRERLYDQITPLVQLQPEEEVQAQPEEKKEDTVQAKAENSEKEETVQLQPEEEEAQAKAEEEEAVQTKQDGPSSDRGALELDSLLPSTKGAPMMETIRARMEDHFGADFSGVRIHTDSAAVRLSKGLKAKALTHGSDIYFNEGQFAPGTQEGAHLLAHELTHTIQQGAVQPKQGEQETPGALPVQPQPEEESLHRKEEGEEEPVSDKEKREKLDLEVTAEPPAVQEDQSTVPVELPPAPAPVGEEEVAAVEKAALTGGSDEAMTQFMEVSPSSMAATFPVLGQTLDQKMGEEQQAEVENPPVLTAVTSGQLDEGITPPGEIPTPDAEIGDGKTGQDPCDQKADPFVDRSPVPDNEKANQFLEANDKGEEGGFMDWLRSNMGSFLSKVRTTDPNVKTDPGAAPKVDLSGDADPERMSLQRQDAETALKGQRDDLSAQLKAHPGQKNIQPKAVNEERPAQLTAEKSVTVSTQEETGMADYVEAQLPAEVRTRSDELLKPKLEGNLAAAKQQTAEAAQKRDTDKKAEVDKAQEEVRQSNQKADEEQRTVVLDNRKNVAREQKQGIEDAYKEVDEFNQQADTRHNEAKKDINREIKEKEEGAGQELKKGEDKAREIKEQGEKDAQKEKEKLEKEQKNRSWWDRVKSAVKKAIKAITDAIDKVFKWVREKVKEAIEAAKKAAIDLINKARNYIKEKLEDFRRWAKEVTNKFLKDRFPGLAKRINKAIDDFVDTAKKGVDKVADAAVAAVEFVANALSKALDKILQVFQTALKAAVQIAGAVLTGDFAEALRIAIQAVCDIAGIDSKPIFDFIDRAKDQILNILRHPLRFFGNLVDAVGGGIRAFFKNIDTHLKKGLISWLTGSLSEVNLQIPDQFDLKGIISIVVQVLGLTYENIKAKVIKRLPGAAQVIDGIEKGISIVGKLVTEGPVALWQEVKEKIADFKETIMSGISSFVITTVIKEGITWLLSLLNPAAAIVKAIKLIIDFVLFLVDNFQRIIDFVKSVYNSLSAIAAGAIGVAVKAVEDSLSRILPIAISLLANLAGLRGIAKTVKKIIRKISKPINKIINKLVSRMVAFGKKLLGKGKKAVSKLLNWWKLKSPISGEDGKRHSLQFQGSGKTSKLIVKSTPTPVEAFLKTAGGKIEKMPEGKDKNKKQLAHQRSVGLNQQVNQLQQEIEAAKPAKKDAVFNKLKKAHNDLARQMAPLFGLDTAELPPAVLFPMVNNVKAKSVEAKFISMDRSKTPAGQTADAHRGNLRGWQKLIDEGIREKENWVKMHLLHHNLGGKATDSNLTPAKSSINQRFYRGLEKPALDDISGGKTAIWYRIDISYHSQEPDYINQISAQYGFYDPKKNWKKEPAKKTWSATVEPPKFGGTSEVVSLNESGKKLLSLFNFNQKKLDNQFINILILERNKSLESGGFIPYTGLDNLLNRLERRFPGEKSLISRNISLLTRARVEGKFKI